VSLRRFGHFLPTALFSWTPPQTPVVLWDVAAVVADGAACYNNQRRHAPPGYVAPAEYERAA
jgi:hypothetical protein